MIDAACFRWRALTRVGLRRRPTGDRLRMAEQPSPSFVPFVPFVVNNVLGFW